MGNVKQPLITVVMPNYNGHRFVKQAIDSVLSQSYSNFELIVVDDHSKDDSLQLIRRKAQSDNRIRIIALEQNAGVANARNVGIMQAKGEYIALLDNDDMWVADKLKRQLALAQKGADIVYCSYDFIDEQNNAIKKPFIVPPQADYNKMLASNIIGCSTCFVKTELMQAHPFNPSFYHEDYVLWMELLQVCLVAYGDQQVLMHYRQVDGSRSNKKGNAAKERWNVYRKALKLNLFTSTWAFVRYAVNGVIKYYL
ncbi:MAG: glycosyltransferase [Clostridia bacterium]|nr:glycosyltransferase [Clostridia bacterium]